MSDIETLTPWEGDTEGEELYLPGEAEIWARAAELRARDPTREMSLKMPKKKVLLEHQERAVIDARLASNFVANRYRAEEIVNVRKPRKRASRKRKQE